MVNTAKDMSGERQSVERSENFGWCFASIVFCVGVCIYRGNHVEWKQLDLGRGRHEKQKEKRQERGAP